MLLLFTLQLVVLGLLVLQGWRDTKWTIEAAALIRAASRYSIPSLKNMVAAWGQGKPPMPAAEIIAHAIGEGETSDAEQDPIGTVAHALRRRSYVLRGIARLASVTTMLSIVIELSWGLGGGSGLEALQAGLPQRLAIERVTTSLSIGAATLMLYVWVARRLRSRMGDLLGALRALINQLAESR